MAIKDLYRKTPLTIEPTATIKEALQEMIERGSNGLLVVNKEKKVVGILSLQDIAGAVVPDDMQNNVALAQALYKEGFFEETAKTMANKKVTEIMRTNFTSVSPEANIMEAAAEFLQNDLYIIPVVQNDKLEGVVSRSEIKKALAKAMGLTTS